MVETSSSSEHLFSSRGLSEVHTPATIAGIINGNVELTDEERRSVLAADALSLGIEDRGVLVAADIFIRNGIFRAQEVLGFDFDQSVNARDLVKVDPQYEASWIQFNLLRQELMAEVAIYKKTGKDNEEIAAHLDVEVSEVEDAMQKLTEYGIFGGKKSHEIRHVFLRDYVAKVDEERYKFDLGLATNAQMGQRIGRASNVVSGYRSENRNRGRISTISRREVFEAGQNIRAIIARYPELSAKQMVDLLEEKGFKGVTLESINHHRVVLANDNRIERRGQTSTKGKSKAEIRERSRQVQEILERELDKFLKSGELVVLSELVKNTPELEGVPTDTIVRMYRRKQSRGELVPPLRSNRSRKQIYYQ